MKPLMKVSRVLFSMRTAMILLLLLIAACIAGSILPQGEIEAYYLGYYSKSVGHLILFLGLDDVFHSVWFISLTIFLCVNLLGCNLIHAPMLIRRMRSDFTPEANLKKLKGEMIGTIPSDPNELFEKLGFRHIEDSVSEGRAYRYSVRHKIGIWGPWLTHFGMLIIIIGFSLGQMKTEKFTVYGVPGETKAVGDTDYDLTINDFSMSLREDDTVDQYTSDLTMTDRVSGESHEGKTSVNHPLSLFGMKLYQNSTGWAAEVQIWKGEELIQHGTLCAGEHTSIDEDGDLVLAFNSFYPDYVSVDGSPSTASSALNHPAYLYTLYYKEQVLGMNVLQEKEMITVEDYTIIFTDPKQYTLIQIKKDPFTWIALIGGVLILAALYFSFYMRLEELWAVKQDDGSWNVDGRSRKGGVLYREKITENILACGGDAAEQADDEA